MKYLIPALSSLLWRIRGGLRIFGHKLPWNKVWFALWYAGAFCYLTKFELETYIVCAIATYTSYQEYGWGEYFGCLLVGEKPTDRSDCPLVDDIIDFLKITIKGHVYKLTDFPRLFGWVGLTLRGLLMTFMIGLAFRSVPFMLCGLAMGTITWIGGLIDHYIIKDGKNGWNWAEWLYGFYLGLCLILIFGR